MPQIDDLVQTTTERDTARPVGKSTKNEDEILRELWESSTYKGDGQWLYKEVGVKGPKELRKGSSERRLDGLVVRPAIGRKERKKKAFKQDLEADPGWTSADVIEVKAGLSEAVIGQALVGKWQFENHHGLPVKALRVACRHVDPAMKWAAKQLGIQVHRFKSASGKNVQMKSRRHYALQNNQLRRIAAYRTTAPGRFVTRIPIGGPRSDVDAWKRSEETYVGFLHLPDHPAQDIVVFEDIEQLRADVSKYGLELVLPRKKLGRGAIGKVEVHAMMLAEQYGLEVTGKVIVCEKEDAAIRGCAAELFGIRVEMVAAVKAATGDAVEESQDEEDEA